MCGVIFALKNITSKFYPQRKIVLDTQLKTKYNISILKINNKILNRRATWT